MMDVIGRRLGREHYYFQPTDRLWGFSGDTPLGRRSRQPGNLLHRYKYNHSRFAIDHRAKLLARPAIMI